MIDKKRKIERERKEKRKRERERMCFIIGWICEDFVETPIVSV